MKEKQHLLLHQNHPTIGEKNISPELIKKKRRIEKLKLAEKKGRETFKEQIFRTVL